MNLSYSTGRFLRNLLLATALLVVTGVVLHRPIWLGFATAVLVTTTDYDWSLFWMVDGRKSAFLAVSALEWSALFFLASCFTPASDQAPVWSLVPGATLVGVIYSFIRQPTWLNDRQLIAHRRFLRGTPLAKSLEW